MLVVTELRRPSKLCLELAHYGTRLTPRLRVPLRPVQQLVDQREESESKLWILRFKIHYDIGDMHSITHRRARLVLPLACKYILKVWGWY